MNRLIKVTFAGIILAIGLVSQSASALPACTFGHCTTFHPMTVELCAARYGTRTFDKTHTADLFENGAACVCPCSCVSSETLIQLFDGEEIMARTVRKDDTLLLPQATYRDGLVFGAAGSRIEKGEVQQILFDNDQILTVSTNHTFVTMQGKLITAQNVKNGQLIQGTDGKSVSVTQSRRIKNFTGSLFNVIVKEKSENPKDHLISTNGVQSGDWLLQTTQDVMKEEIDLRLGKVRTLSEIIK